jgi:hypothetical protein
LLEKKPPEQHDQGNFLGKNFQKNLHISRKKCFEIAKIFGGCVCVVYLECIAGEIEKSWQSTSSEVDISVHKQVLKSHLHLWQLHSHTAAAFTKL